ncbi:MAG TPA: hypothetical protein VE868_06470, partial [Balneolaceae bacterium]|nr:hypothetical protein [Balneolaceae bacterium]
MTNGSAGGLTKSTAGGISNSAASNSQTLLSAKYQDLSPFGVSYDKITPKQASGYRLVIVDPSNYTKSEVRALKATGATVVAYLSVGE